MRLTSVIPLNTNTMLTAIIVLFLLVVLVATEPDSSAEGAPEAGDGARLDAAPEPARPAANRWTQVRERFCAANRTNSAAHSGKIAGISRKQGCCKLLS